MNEKIQTVTFNRPQAAKKLGISLPTLDRNLDKLPHVRIGRRVLFSEESIRQILEKQSYRPKTNR